MQPRAKWHCWPPQACPQGPQGNRALEAPRLKGASFEDFDLLIFSCMKEYIHVYPKPLNVWHFKIAATANWVTERLPGILWMVKCVRTMSCRLSQTEFPATGLAFFLRGGCVPPSLGSWYKSLVSLAASLPLTSCKPLTTKACQNRSEVAALHSVSFYFKNCMCVVTGACVYTRADTCRAAYVEVG